MVDDTSPLGFLQRTLRPTWVDLAPLVMEDEAASLDHATAKLWSLVLASRHIPYRMRTRSKGEGGGHTVQVQPWFEERAVEEIRLYLSENAQDGRPLFLPDLRPVSGMEPTIAIMSCMVLFFWVYNRTYPSLSLYPQRWLDFGSARASDILNGDVWRVFTALTLHGDIAHVVGNALIGGGFVWVLSRRLGARLALVLTLL